MSDKYNIPKEYLDDAFDFGFSATDSDMSKDSAEISEIQQKLDLIMQMNSTCEGANAVKAKYDELMKAKLIEVERIILPLLVNLRKNEQKDYIHWPGRQRVAQCDLQIQNILHHTRSDA